MITEKITSGQKKQLMRVLEDGVDVLNLTKDQTDIILKVGNLVQADLKTSLKKHSTTDKFGPAIREFEITVPVDYNHDTQIDSSREKALRERTTRYYSDKLTSKNYAEASNELIPDRTYKVKIFPINSDTNYSEIIAFLEKQKTILVGGQGLTLVYDLAKDQLPKDKQIVSFDKDDYLLNIGSDQYVPSINPCSNGNIFKFYTYGYSRYGYFYEENSKMTPGGGSFGNNSCLLCFYDK